MTQSFPSIRVNIVDGDKLKEMLIIDIEDIFYERYGE